METRVYFLFERMKFSEERKVDLFAIMVAEPRAGRARTNTFSRCCVALVLLTAGFKKTRA